MKQAQCLFAQKNAPIGGVIFCSVFSEISVGNIGQERKMTGAFDSGGQLALMACAGSGNSSGNDFSSFRKESSEARNIFIVDLCDFINAECANLFAAATVTVHGSFRSFRSFHDKSSFIDFQLITRIALWVFRKEDPRPQLR